MLADEFDTLEHYDDCYRYELIDGVLVVRPVPSDAVADMNDLLGYLLYEYKTQHPRGHSLDASRSRRCIRSTNSRRLVERGAWTGLGRRPNSARDVPAIAIDFVLTDTRDWVADYRRRSTEYLNLGVLEYWIIDRFRRSMTVYRRTNDAPQKLVIGEDGVYTTELLPGFELPLARLLAAADEWEDQS